MRKMNWILGSCIIIATTLASGLICQLLYSADIIDIADKYDSKASLIPITVCVVSLIAYLIWYNTACQGWIKKQKVIPIDKAILMAVIITILAIAAAVAVAVVILFKYLDIVWLSILISALFGFAGNIIAFSQFRAKE